MENSLKSFTFWKGDFTESAIEQMKMMLWFPQNDGCTRIIDTQDEYIRVNMTDLQYCWVMKNLSIHAKMQQAQVVEEDVKPKRTRKRKEEAEKDEVVNVIEEAEATEESPIQNEEQVEEEEPKKEVSEECAEDVSKDDLIERCLRLLEEHNQEEVEVPVSYTFKQGTSNVIAAIIKAKKTKSGLFLTLEAQEGSPENYVGKTTTCNANNALISTEAMAELYKQMDSVLGLPFE